MSLIIRPIEQNDAESCGKIGYEAHKAISSAHGYPSEQPSEEFGIELIRRLLDNPNSWGVLAERHGKTLGSIFLHEFPPSPVAATLGGGMDESRVLQRAGWAGAGSRLRARPFAWRAERGGRTRTAWRPSACARRAARTGPRRESRATPPPALSSKGSDPLGQPRGMSRDVALAALPLRRALLAERAHALAEVLAAEAALAQLDELALEVLRQPAGVRAQLADHALVARQR